MVWVKRLLAVVAAVGLIVGAVVIRRSVIESDGNASSSASTATTLVCPTELAVICTAAAAGQSGWSVRIEEAATTAKTLSAAQQADAKEVWLTFDPLPDTVEQRRDAAGRPRLGFDTSTVAASQLALVVPTDRSSALESACSGMKWTCVGVQAGRPWSDLGADVSGSVRPAFAPLTTGIGQLSVTAAVRGYFGAASIDGTDPGFIAWGRRLERAVSASQLSGGTPIATIQVRSSALDVAVGAEAELATARRGDFAVLYAAPMMRVDLVLAVPAGVSVPSGLTARLAAQALGAGWLAAGNAGLPSATPTAGDVLAATALWSEL
jgi:hypothetical protein